MNLPPTAEQLRVEASRVRSYLENSKFRCFAYFPGGCCKAASVFLLRWFAETLGVSDGLLIANGTRHDQSHAWVAVGRLIVDITADQFDDFDDPLFIGVESEWHSSFCGAQAFPQAKTTNLNSPYSEEYTRMAQHLAEAAQRALDPRRR